LFASVNVFDTFRSLSTAASYFCHNHLNDENGGGNSMPSLLLYCTATKAILSPRKLGGGRSREITSEPPAWYANWKLTTSPLRDHSIYGKIEDCRV